MNLASQLPAALDPQTFIAGNLLVKPVPGLPAIRLYTAHERSGLRRLIEGAQDPTASPFWAYPWAGGIVLACHLLDNPQLAGGRRVLDLGAGSGLVGIAAAKAGARAVIASEIDPNGRAAIGLNAQLNVVDIEIGDRDLLDGEPPEVDLVLVGDLFYAAALAKRVTRFLRRCRTAGVRVLVGDPGRKFLPLNRLERLADYPVADFGGGGSRERSAVYAWRG